MEFDLFTLLPLAAAAFVFWKLRSVLGTRNGAEPTVPPARAEDGTPFEAGDNVVRLPSAQDKNRGEEAEAAQVKARKKAVEKHSGKDPVVKKGLEEVMARDDTFDPNEFVSGARAAYEMIVTAFADGDKQTLESLLADDVYDNFAAAIDARTEAGETMQSSFVGIEKAALTGAEMVRDEAHVTMTFVSQIISATLDSDGEIVDGDLNEVAEVNDVWTFARSVTSRDPNWKLVATDA